MTYAIVDLPDAETSEFLLSELSSLDNVQNVFDLSTITNNPYDLRVGPRLTGGTRSKGSRSRSRARRKREKGKLAAEAEAARVAAAAGTSPGQAVQFGGKTSGKPAQQASIKMQTTEDAPWFKNSNNKGGGSAKRNRNTSGTSRQSDDEDTGSESQSESEAESDDESTSREQPVSSKEADNRLHGGIGTHFSRPQAGGVRRLAQELGVDGVVRSASDRNVYSSKAKRSTTTSTTGPSLVTVCVEALLLLTILSP